MQVPLRRELASKVYQLKSSQCRLQAVTNTSMKLNEPVAMKATYASTVDILVISPEISLSSLIMLSRWETSRSCSKGEPRQANLQICIPLTSNIHISYTIVYCWNPTGKTTALWASYSGFRLLQKQHWPLCGSSRETAHHSNIFPLMMETVNGHTLINGPITKETPPVEFKIGNHVEELQFDIIHALRYPLILGIHWLETHEWSTHTISFPSRYCHYNCFRHRWNRRHNDEITAG